MFIGECYKHLRKKIKRKKGEKKKFCSQHTGLELAAFLRRSALKSSCLSVELRQQELLSPEIILYELYDSRLVSSKSRSPGLHGYSSNIFGRFICKYPMAYKGNLTNRGLNLSVEIFICRRFRFYK